MLDCIGFCPQIIQCSGDDFTVENGVKFYNLFLEFAAGGNLSDHMKKQGGRLPENDVKRYTKSIVKGIHHVHLKGFVHCDIKLQNILVFDNGDVKIADFGLAKKTGEVEKQRKTGEKYEYRGTPLFMSPESVRDNVYESPADIWALGCVVVEMVTGKPAWRSRKGSDFSDVCSILMRIGVGEELPEIPEELSEEGRDFLRKCLVRDPAERWTAEMLLEHPFLKIDGEEESSPRCHFDFSDWISGTNSLAPCSPESGEWSEWEFETTSFSVDGFCSPVDRLRQLVTDERPNWSGSGWERDDWMVVR